MILSTLSALALAFTACATDNAAAQPKEKITAFIAAASSRLRPGEALTALRAGPPEEYYRWGVGICKELRAGRPEKNLIEGNLDQFFGPELAMALTFAARTVICPEAR